MLNVCLGRRGATSIKGGSDEVIHTQEDTGSQGKTVIYANDGNVKSSRKPGGDSPSFKWPERDVNRKKDRLANTPFIEEKNSDKKDEGKHSESGARPFSSSAGVRSNLEANTRKLRRRSNPINQPEKKEKSDEPFFTVKLMRHKELEYGFGPRFVAYTIEVSNNVIQWKIRKRYSEFHKLHEDIEAVVSKNKIKLPRFPPKTWKRSLDKKFIEERGVQLERWLQRVMRYTELACSPHTMEFIGALNDLNKVKKEHLFTTMTIARYLQKAQTGDVILFRTVGLLSSSLRVITTCEYDHVAMVVALPSNWEDISTWEDASTTYCTYLLEASGDGVEVYRLRNRLRAWSLCDAQVVKRSLIYNRGEEFEKATFNFAKGVRGKKYGFRVTEIMRKKSYDDLDERSSFFCSELVASFFKKVGLFPAEKAANAYYPSTFSGEEGPKLLKEACWGEEVLLTFETPSVGKSKLAIPHST